jgi:hypothetical protein
VSYGGDRFTAPTIKGVVRPEGYFMYAGEAWLCHELLLSDRDFDDYARELYDKYRTDWAGEFPAEFIQVLEGSIFVRGSHEIFGPFPQYFAIGSGGSLGRALLKGMFPKQVPTVTGAKRVLGRIFQIVSEDLETVQLPVRYHLEEVL